MRIWVLQKGEKIAHVDVKSEELHTLVFSPDDKNISRSRTGVIKFHNVGTRKAKQILDTTGKFILSIAYSPDGKYIASGTFDDIVYILDVAENKLWHLLEDHLKPIRSLCFLFYSQLLLIAAENSYSKLYDLKHTNVVETLPGHISWVSSVAFSLDDKHFVFGSSDKTAKM